MSTEYILEVCPLCASTIVGFNMLKLSTAMHTAKCAYCRKKKECDTYRVWAIRKEKGDANG